MNRCEIEENLRDDLAFRDELVADRDRAKERAEAQYAKALVEIDESRKLAKREYLDALAEADERIKRADRAIERSRAKLARLDE